MCYKGHPTWVVRAACLYCPNSVSTAPGDSNTSRQVAKLPLTGIALLPGRAGWHSWVWGGAEWEVGPKTAFAWWLATHFNMEALTSRPAKYPMQSQGSPLPGLHPYAGEGDECSVFLRRLWGLLDALVTVWLLLCVVSTSIS